MCASPRNVTQRYAGHVSGPNVSSRSPRGATRMNQIRTLLPAPRCRAPFFAARMFQHGVIFRTPCGEHKYPNKFNNLRRYKMRGLLEARAWASYRIETKNPFYAPVLALHRPQSHAPERFGVIWHTPCFERYATQAYRRQRSRERLGTMGPASRTQSRYGKRQTQHARQPERKNMRRRKPLRTRTKSC
jgi:hypothetical protein